MKSTKSLPRTVLHEELLGMMRTRAMSEAREEIRSVVGAALGYQPIVSRAYIHGSIIVQPDPNRAGLDVIGNVFTNGKPIKPLVAVKPKRKYRRSAAGRARQIAAMKRYWAAKRKAAKK